MLAAISAASDDGLKLLLLVVVGGGLLALGRWSSRLGANPTKGNFATDAPTPDVKELLPDRDNAPRD